MRRAISFLVISFVLYSIYFDLSHGTLSVSTFTSYTNEEQQEDTIVTSEIKTYDQLHGDDDSETSPTPTNTKMTHSSIVLKVQAGQTVLSIEEEIHDGPLPVSIQKLIEDFESLNPGSQAEKIQIGQTYTFPIYEK